MAEIEPIELKRGKSVNISLAFAPHSAKPVANGAASAGDDTITIDALDSYMSAGTTVVFSSGATFKLSVEATKGTTTLTSNGDAANDLSGNIADNETGVVPSKNFYTSDARYTAKLVLRRKIGNSFNGPIIDTLESNTSGNQQNESGRIRFPNIGDTSSLPNIVLYWSGAEATALPNEDVSVYGDLQITDTNVASTEVIHSIRLRFDIKAEII
jgi:hypothetical protein